MDKKHFWPDSIPSKSGIPPLIAQFVGRFFAFLFIGIVLSLILGGCSSNPPSSKPTLVVTQCEALPPVPNPLTMGELLAHDAEVVGLYAKCAEKVQSLVQ